MRASTPHEATDGRLLRDRRKELVERSVGVYGLQRAVLVQGEGVEWMLRLDFIADLSEAGSTGIPPNLSVENIQIMDVEFGGTSSLVPRLLLPIGDSSSVYVLLQTGTDWFSDDSAGLFEVVLSGLPEVDSILAKVEFGFGVQHHQFDTRERGESTVGSHDNLGTSTYLCKDEESIRQMMLERLRRTFPEWQERNPADVGVAIIESFTHAADLLSYYQDAVGTEAYADTARQRISLRRHGRLVGMRLSEGTGARTWLSFSVSRDIEIPAHTAAGTASVDLHKPGVSSGGDTVFRTCGSLRATTEQNSMRPYCWGMAPIGLPVGTTSMTLIGHIKSLRTGSMLLISEGQDHGEAGRCHMVRLSRQPVFGKDEVGGTLITQIHWTEADELPFAIRLHDGDEEKNPAVVSGNIVLAEQGEMLSLAAELVDFHESSISVKLRGAGVLCFDRPNYSIPACEQRSVRAQKSVPQVLVVQSLPGGRQRVWTAVFDLLSSSAVDTHFVVETNNKSDLQLRFGDGRLGQPMPPADQLTVLANIGHGQVGNVGEEALTNMHTQVSGVLSVTNPISAAGGSEPDTLGDARRRILRRGVEAYACVDLDDYKSLAETHPQVREASAVQGWNGTFPVVTVYILPEHGDSPGHAMVEDVRSLMEKHRRIGVRVDVQPAGIVHLDLRLKITVSDRLPLATVRNQILEALGLRPSASMGLFSVSAWGLGRCVYESPVVRAVANVPGVKWSETTQFERRDTAGRMVEDGVILVQPHEVARLDGSSIQLELEVLHES
jgi:hypothetical protein